MGEWYKSTYCNRRDWIFENLDVLNLNIQEAMFCLLIDYCNSNRISISYETFEKKLKLDRNSIDAYIVNLTSKGYLKIDIVNNSFRYDLSPLFESGLEAANDANFEDIFAVFERAFGRPLNNLEMQKLADLSKRFDNEKIFEALRVADAYQKLSLAYIETILNNGC